MKMQLTKVQILDFASRAGTFTTTVDATNRVLEILASEGIDPISRKDVVVVVQAMAESRWPEDFESLNAIVKHLGRAPGRGYYTQGHMVGVKTLSEKVVEMAEAGDIRIATKAGIRFAGNMLLSVDEDVLGYYTDDPGLRRIAADQTRCFGFYSQSAGACRSCPLASFCAEAQMGKIGEIASRLDAETEATIKLALEPVEPEPTEDAEPDHGHETMTLPFEGVCSGCQNVMAEGSEGVYVEGSGLHHVACVPSTTDTEDSHGES
jgi:hypothetical protein